MTPGIAVLLGDPAGIGPELIARLLAKPENRARADLLIIGDRRELEMGMEIAGQRFEYNVGDNKQAPLTGTGTPSLIDFRLADDAPYERAVSTERGGRYSLESFKQ